MIISIKCVLTSFLHALGLKIKKNPEGIKNCKLIIFQSSINDYDIVIEISVTK